MLKIQGLNKTYGNGVQALNEVSLDIPKGMYGLLGPNGAGKSSLMRTIASLQTADSGAISLDDVDVLQQVDHLRQRLGYLPQEFGVYPRTSPMAFLDHIATLKGVINKKERRELVENLLVQTNLWDARKKNMTTFSGGMKQRIGIAQALIGQPELVIVTVGATISLPRVAVAWVALLPAASSISAVILMAEAPSVIAV